MCNVHCVYIVSIAMLVILAWVDASYGGSKSTRVLVSKVYLNRKINIKMKKNIENQCWVGPRCGD